MSQEQLDRVFELLAEKPRIELPEDYKIYILHKACNDGISPAALLNELMMYFAKKAGVSARRWVEKTPRHAFFIPEILRMFPNARIINVVRGPRDVVSSSFLSRSFDSNIERRRFCASRAERWNKEITIAMQATVSNQQTITIRYEDIVSNTSGSLKTIMQFLEEKYYPDVLDIFSQNYKSVIVTQEHQHKELASAGRIIDRRGIWRTRMSEDDAEVVKLICAKLMAELGYISNKELMLLEIRKRLWLHIKLKTTRQAFLSLLGTVRKNAGCV